MIFGINKARKITHDYQKREAKQIDQDADKLARTLLDSPSFVNDAANAIEERIDSNIHDMASIGKSYCDYCDGFVQDKIIYSENMIKVLDAENDVLLKFRIAGYNVKVDEGRIYW